MGRYLFYRARAESPEPRGKEGGRPTFNHLEARSDRGRSAVLGPPGSGGISSLRGTAVAGRRSTGMQPLDPPRSI